MSFSWSGDYTVYNCADEKGQIYFNWQLKEIRIFGK